MMYRNIKRAFYDMETFAVCFMFYSLDVMHTLPMSMCFIINIVNYLSIFFFLSLAQIIVSTLYNQKQTEVLTEIRKFTQRQSNIILKDVVMYKLLK
jgi:hypothetical protein